MLDNLINIESIVENYEEEIEGETIEEEIITPLKYKFENISIISNLYEEAVYYQNEELEEEDIIENMEEEGYEEEKKYYKPEYVEEKPVTIIDKLDEIFGEMEKLQ